MELYTGHIYNYTTFPQMLEDIGELPETVTGKRADRRITYMNVPAAYDTETTSFEENGEKRALTYAFMFGLCGRVCLVRTWDEFMDMMRQVTERYNLSTERRLIVYVHNLGFEFGFMGRRFEWDNIFSADKLNPIYACTKTGIEFRDSMILAGGVSLDTVGKNLTKHHIRKLTGKYDYRKLRHSKTPLTPREILYCVNDVFVLLAYIAEKIEQHEKIWKIPLTNTGYVRQYCRDACYKVPGYYNFIHNLTIRSLDELDKLMKAYGGGYTHASAQNVGNTFYHVASFDFTSSYPATLLSKMFPVGKSFTRHVNSLKQFLEMTNRNCNYCSLFTVTFFGLKRRPECPDSYISHCKVDDIKESTAWNDNGRIVECERVTLTITDVDYRCIARCYTWDSIQWDTHFTCYKKGYLPKPLIESILHFYEGKTTLKGIEAEAEMYQMMKGMLNAIYGAMVQKLNMEEIVFENGEWSVEQNDPQTVLDMYNKNPSRFLYLPWGIWCTAHARENLWSGICAAGKYYIYSDTDSVKIQMIQNENGEWVLPPVFADYVERYNNAVLNACRKCLEFYGIEDIENKLSPKDKKGKPHPIGVWDFECVYDAFKTMGAKRYIVQKNNAYERYEYNEETDSDELVETHDINITVSGVNKYHAVPWLLKESERTGKSPFDLFTEGLIIPVEDTGKSIHTYGPADTSSPVRGVLTDYTGLQCEYEELSFVHLAPTGYKMSLDPNYDAFIEYIQHGQLKPIKQRRA